MIQRQSRDYLGHFQKSFLSHFKITQIHKTEDIGAIECDVDGIGNPSLFFDHDDCLIVVGTAVLLELFTEILFF